MTRARAIGVAAVALLLIVSGAIAVLTLGQRPVAEASPTISPSPTPTPTRRPTPTPSPTPSPTPVPTPTPVPLNAEYLNRRLTFLLVGVDNSAARQATGLYRNTDSMVVVSVNAAHNEIAMVALPRDTVDLQLADGSIWRGKANGIMNSLGIDALRGALSRTYGIPIDYHVAINMDDLRSIVDAVGGVAVTTTQRVYDARLRLDLPPGRHGLTGDVALKFVRTRADSDYGRAQRQQQVILALLHRISDRNVRVDYLALAGALGGLQTNVPLADLPTLLAIARRSDASAVTTQVLGPPRFALFQGFDGPRGWVMIPNIPEMRAYVGAVMGD